MEDECLAEPILVAPSVQRGAEFLPFGLERKHSFAQRDGGDKVIIVF